ncbi:MAG TPA: DNA-binding response regulator [Microscillaceae bacterium]|nr:DNA-binding response regulator [Microscillaceae bacterium]
MPVKCLLVDDESPAIDLLKKHISALPDLEVAAACYSVMEAAEVLKHQSIDLIFLDIQMPVLTGLDFLKSVKNLPKVILTTAYREYALDGYDLDIVDYLLKPISFERFFKAVERYYARATPQQQLQTTASLQASKPSHIYVNVNKKNHKVLFESILYIESLKDYVRIHTTDKALVVKSNIGAIATQLPPEQFLRIHRSFIVALDKVTAYTALDVEIGAIEIPIGQTYREVIKKLAGS